MCVPLSTIDKTSNVLVGPTPVALTYTSTRHPTPHTRMDRRIVDRHALHPSPPVSLPLSYPVATAKVSRSIQHTQWSVAPHQSPVPFDSSHRANRVRHPPHHRMSYSIAHRADSDTGASGSDSITYHAGGRGLGHDSAHAKAARCCGGGRLEARVCEKIVRKLSSGSREIARDGVRDTALFM